MDIVLINASPSRSSLSLTSSSLTKSIKLFDGDDADIFQCRFYCYYLIITINCNTTNLIITIFINTKITITINTNVINITTTTNTTTTTNLLPFYRLLYKHYKPLILLLQPSLFRDVKRR